MQLLYSKYLSPFSFGVHSQLLHVLVYVYFSQSVNHHPPFRDCIELFHQRNTKITRE